MSYRNDDYVEWVKKAQLGDKGSLHRLAEAVRVRLHESVFRLTLNEDLTEDIVQETILDMLRVFGKLRRAEKFWPWLYGIAFNKVRNHYGRRWRQKTRTFSETGYEPAGKPGGDALAEAVTKELKQIVLQSIRQLEPRHRAVLTMRCYDHMSYAEIAGVMGRSEIAARALFYRAKKALARRLAARGLAKGSLLIALVAFGKMTATSKAAAAQVSVTAGTLKVGPVAALVASATGKVGVATAVTIGALVAGSVAVSSDPVASIFGSRRGGDGDLPVAPWQGESSAGEEECWYYCPEGPGGAVMVRLVEFDSRSGNALCRILENQYANYHADVRAGRVYVNSCRAWKPDLSVKRLPTDSEAMSEFIAQVEGREPDMQLTANARRGMLVACKRHRGKESRIWRIDRHVNVLEEEYFHFSWPESTRVIDNRDAMHKRGWTYFRIEGQISGQRVSGRGRLPFVFASSGRHHPWLELRVGRDFTAVDTADGAWILDESNRVSARYAGGSFFKGLCRPWMGLHCIDTIRRDAAEQRLPFDTTYDGRSGRATITVRAEPVSLVYTVDMEMDVVERITFLRAGAQAGDPAGELRFDYLQDVDAVQDMFAAPPRVGSGAPAGTGPGMLWLSRLVEAQ